MKIGVFSFKNNLILFIIILIINCYCINCNEESLESDTEADTICEREGQTICQSFCSPVSFKKCKKNITSQNYDYCCTCEFHEGDFKSNCINVIPIEY